MNETANVVTAAGAVVTALGLLIGFWQFRKQMNAQTFLTYTQRYEAIMAVLPLEVRLRRFDEETSIAFAANTVVKDAYLRYFNLCSEEYYLWRTGHLSSQLWKIWEHEIVRTARSPLGRAVWKSVRHEFDSFSEFREWLEMQAPLNTSIPTGASV
jgi:hypothetical protein